METTWFMLVAVMIAIYVVLDGFDLGAGIVQLLVARTDGERRQVLRTIGPVWDGNKYGCWPAAARCTLLFRRSTHPASAGSHLPLMMVLWLLISAGYCDRVSKSHRQPGVEAVLDVVFGGASALLAIFFGAALGNVVRGVPLDASGKFAMAFFTNFSPFGAVGILDWFTVSVAVAAFATLMVHGALWVALKTSSELAQRARRAAAMGWWALLPLVVLITWSSFAIQPRLSESFGARPWGYVFPLLAVAGLIGMRVMHRRDLAPFLCSALFIVGMLTSAAFGLYPYVLPSNLDPRLGLTVYNAAAAPYGLKVGLVWFIPGMLLTAGYFVYTYRSFAGKVAVEEG